MVNLILKNRSLAENNPLNLLKIDGKFQALYESIGEKRFIDFVNGILDLYE